MLQNVMALLSGLHVPMGQSDIPNTYETPQVNATDANQTYTGQELAAGDLYRTIGAARTDTLPTADQLIKALMGNINLVTPPGNELYGNQPNRSVQLEWPATLMPFQPGSSFRRTIVSTAAFAITLAVPSNAGITLGAAPFNNTVVAASTWREYLFQILNSSPQQSLAMNQTNASPLLTVPAGFLSFINNLTPGMSVYGTNVAAGTKINAINRDTGVITLSANVTATIANNPITFTPTVVVNGMRSGAV